MDRNSNSYVVAFAMGICVVCSAALALTFNGLKPRIDANQAFDRQKNVLKAVGYWDPVAQADMSRGELERLFDSSIERLVLRKTAGGLEEVGESMTEREIADALKAAESERDFRDREYLELYRGTDPETGTVSYVLPTLGYGLWSWMYGFLALTEDGAEVVGITYYQDGETPGLGAEINNPDWQRSWRGKKLYDDSGELVSVTVKKGRVSQDNPVEAAHYVDGLSGATITSSGVTKYLKRNLEAFAPFFRKS